eukprot:m.146915 g.146915  ORF g.146915 m.146915 type:complete len:53 (+) comp16098_c0_seq1:171-329(+)
MDGSYVHLDRIQKSRAAVSSSAIQSKYTKQTSYPSKERKWDWARQGSSVKFN